MTTTLTPDSAQFTPGLVFRAQAAFGTAGSMPRADFLRSALFIQRPMAFALNGNAAGRTRRLI